jgi:serine/threonine protein kinase
VPVQSAKTESQLFEPGSSQQEDEARRRRAMVPGRPNLLKLGTVLQNRYRVLDVLGVGGMSTVYKARDLRFTSVDRACAIKEMFNSAEEMKLRQLRLANFQREASLLATLTHSAIPRIYDYFEHQGTIYLVLELIHGNDLETILSQRGEPFEEKQVVDWAIDLCGVLHYLHNQKPEPIIFRDLKPSNVMIRSEDQALMLVDFGIARTFAPQQRGTMIGTEGYAPPEQYKGIADARGDIYALGATLHHLSTGNDPRTETPFTFASRPPRKLNSALSQGFEDLVLRSVSYHADDRFQSIAEFKEALEEIRTRRIQGLSNGASIEAAPARVSAVDAAKRERSSGSKLFAAVPDSPAAVEAISAPVPAPVAPTPVANGDDRLDWIVATGDEVRSSATTAGGAVYIGSYDGNLYAIDETDGTVRWRFKTQRGIVSRPTPIAEMVIVGSEDRSVYAVSRQNGRAIWSFQTDMPVRSSAFADERAGVIGSDDGYLYRFDRVKGVVTLRYKTWGPVRSSPVHVGDSIIFGSDDGYLYNVSAETGRLTWRHQIGAPVMSSPAIKGNIIVVGASDGGIRGFALRDGKPLWSVHSSKAVISSATLDGERAYIGSADGHVYAVEIASGELKWKAPVCRQITSSPSIADGQIYVGGNDSVFYCLEQADGAISWRFGAGAAIVTKPLITEDHLIFGSLDGNVYALHRER